MEENFYSNIIIESRKKITVTGVKEVSGFDDETIIMQTSLGKLTIKGSNLKITVFNTDTGELSVDGKVFAAVYTDSIKKGNFLTKVFK